MAKSRSRRRAARVVPGPGRILGRAGVKAAMLRYVESSALVAALLEHDVAARASLRARGKRVTSALTLTETARAIVRGKSTGRLSAADERAALRGLRTFARRCDLVSVTDTILARIGRPFTVEPVRTLDGVHLATIEQLADPFTIVTVVTRDVRVRANVEALGYAVE